jgi:hypothetical protein
MFVRVRLERNKMISSERAQQLKRAGLVWQPAERDFFVIPDSNLEGYVFVVSQLPALVQSFSGEPTITFHGSIEWALDHIVVAEAVWVPAETQLRTELARAIGDDAPLRLDRTGAGYRLQFADGADMVEFDAADAEDTYAQALLHVLQKRAA